MFEDGIDFGAIAGKLVSGAKTSPLSVASIILSNLSILGGVLFLGWSLSDMILLYWAESAIIGFFVILKIISAKGLSFTPQKFGTVIFFMIHYGMFMGAHFMVITGLIIPLLAGKEPNDPFSSLPPLLPLLPGFASLFLSHTLSFGANFVGKKEYERANIGDVMTSPYGRIIAMQVFVIASALVLSFVIDLVPNAFIIYVYAPFTVIGKTFFDLSGHLSEREAGEEEKKGEPEGKKDAP